MVRAAADIARVTVVSPIPYVPPFVKGGIFGRYRLVPAYVRGAVGDIHHPRVLTGPGMWLHAFDARLMAAAVSRLIERIHRSTPVDLIHTQFVYPEGVAAARIGKRLGIPVMTTEQAHWVPWMNDYPAVRKQVLAALPHIALITGASARILEDVRALTDGRARVAVIGSVLDEEVFTAPEPGEPVDMNELLFVGIVRRVKGLDVLVRAFSILAPRHPALRLRVIGNPYQRAYQRDEQVVRDLVHSLGLDDRVRFTGHASPAEVAKAMRQSALLVSPSRREAFSNVTMEALASGTPVVATRTSGPEYIFAGATEAMGRLVPLEDPPAMAAAIEEMLLRRPTVDRDELHRYAVERFGRKASARRIAELYGEVLGDRSPRSDPGVTASIS
jgi:glycosyltransferase involved in cell wall biosynthesis